MAERDVETEEPERLNGDEPPGDEPELPQDDLEPDDDAEPPADDDPEPEADEPPADVEPRRPKQTAQDRVQNALRDRDEARTAADARVAAAEARALAAENAQRERNARDDAIEEQRTLDGLDEHGKAQYLLAKKAVETEQSVKQLAQQLSDSNDRADFNARAARDPRAAKLLPEIEAALRRCPPGTKREAVYFILLGEKLANGTLDSAPQRKQAQRRVDAQRPLGRGAARSDAAPRGTRAGTIVSRMERDDPLI